VSFWISSTILRMMSLVCIVDAVYRFMRVTGIVEIPNCGVDMFNGCRCVVSAFSLDMKIASCFKL